MSQKYEYIIMHYHFQFGCSLLHITSTQRGAPGGKVKLSILLEKNVGLSDDQFKILYVYISMIIILVSQFECLLSQCILSFLPPTWWNRKSRDATHAQLPSSRR